MKLTKDNYFSAEASRAYWSVSQFKAFDACPARAKAILDGTWEDPAADADYFLVGHYVELGLMDPAGFAAFKQDNADRILSKAGSTKGSPKKVFADADKMIKAVERKPEVMRHLVFPEARYQQVLTVDIDGTPWKMMLDVVDPVRRIVVDFKTTANFNHGWRKTADGKNEMIQWYHVHDYIFQIGMYILAADDAYGEEWFGLIAAVTKQDPPACELRSITDRSRLMDYVMAKLEPIYLYDAWKHGREIAPMCGSADCVYCREFAPVELTEAEILVR